MTSYMVFAKQSVAENGEKVYGRSIWLVGRTDIRGGGGGRSIESCVLDPRWQPPASRIRLQSNGTAINSA